MERLRLQLIGGYSLDAAYAGGVGALQGDEERCAAAAALALPGGRGALFALAEGLTAPAMTAFHQALLGTLLRDRGTPASRLQRAVREACRQLDARALHRHHLTSLGTSALLIDASRAVHAFFTQLAPCQAYVLDEDGLRAFPAEQLQRAATVASSTGRSWEVELEMTRCPARPGSSFLICPSALAEELSPSAVAEVMRLPPDQGLAELGQIARRGRGRIASEAAPVAVLARIAAAPAPVRVRLFGIGGHRAERSSRTPSPGGVAEHGTGRATAPGYRLEAWGLERRRRGRVGGTLDRLLGPATFVQGPERRSQWRWIAGGVAVAALGLLLWAAWHRAPFGGALRPAAPASVPGAIVAAPPVLSGTTLLNASAPFGAFAVVPGDGGPRSVVQDRARRLQWLEPGAAAPQVQALPGDAAGGLLTARDSDVLWLDGNRVLRQLLRAGDPPRPLALRGAAAWQRPVAIATYAGNFYVLDTGTGDGPGQIWRYGGTPGGGFDSDPQPWMVLSSGATVNGARGFAIDGSIWVARGEAGLLRLTGGRPDPFQPTASDAQIGSAGAVYTEFGFDSVYVVDAMSRSLVQLSKDGTSARRVLDVFPVGEHPVGLWVDEPGGRALILTDARLQDVTLPK